MIFFLSAAKQIFFRHAFVFSAISSNNWPWNKIDTILMYQGLEASIKLYDFWMVFSTANVKPALSVVSAICFFKHSSNFEMYD